MLSSPSTSWNIASRADFSKHQINSPLVTPLFTLNPPVTPIVESSKLRDTTCSMKQDFITHTTYLITPLSRDPWEANRFSANQEIPRIVWSPKIHYHIYKSPLPPVPILRQFRLVHAPPHITLRGRSILILYSHLRLGLPSGLFPSSFPIKALYVPPFAPIRATCPVHLIRPDFIIGIILGEEYRSVSSLIWRFLHSPVTSSLRRPK